MNILAPFYGTQLLGRERENIECLKALHGLGYTIHVWGSDREVDGGDAGKRLDQLGFLQGLLPFGSHFSISYFLKIRGYWRRQIWRIYSCSMIMNRQAKRIQPEFVFIGGTMEYLYLFPWLCLSKVKVIFRNGDGPIWDSWFHKLVYRSLLKRATYIVPVSPFIESESRRLHPHLKEKIHVILNCVPDDDASEAVNIRKEQTDTLNAIYVGQITPQKGIEILMDAMTLLSKEPIQCTIVGGNKHTRDYEAQLREVTKRNNLNILWTGFDPNPFGKMLESDVHIAPSLYEEPFGLVVIEAKKAGIPSVVFPSGGMKELVSNDWDGMVTTSKSAEVLALTMRKMLHYKHSGRLSTMGLNARLSYERIYSFPIFLLAWSSFLKRINPTSSSARREVF
jgi:glycosyltransferase involved in cell wall biosynthesis